MRVQPEGPAPSAAEGAPASPLMMFVLAALSSMMAPTLDLQLARLAAREAIDACRAQGQHELVTIGQIVGFAVAALDTLRLSMPEDLSLSMKLRLRGNANGLNQSSCSCARILEKARLCERTGVATVRPRPVADDERQSAPASGPAPQGVDGEPAPAMTVANIAATTVANTSAMTIGNTSSTTMANRPVMTVDDTAAPAQAALTGVDWADAMQSVAATLQADAMTASPKQREIDAMWIEALNGIGTELRGEKPKSAGSGGTQSGFMATLDSGGPPNLFGKGKRKRGRVRGRRLN